MENLNFTEAALDRIQTLLQSPESQGAFLRIYIVGGGCSGFQYGFKLEHPNPEEKHSDEIVFEKFHPKEPSKNPIKIVIDPLSYQYLEGASIDYVENLQGAKFKVDNPKAETTCGCGSSFSLKEET